jgi:hypothetical protein
MRPIRGVGPYADIVEAPSPTNNSDIVKLGVRVTTFEGYVRRKEISNVAQYYGIVQGDLMLAKHLFTGLKRSLMYNGDMQADRNVIVYSWRSTNDYRWRGNVQNGHSERVDPPRDQVFVVLVREEPENEHGVLGSIEHWNWVQEDPVLAHAPVDWNQRYGQKLWSK